MTNTDGGATKVGTAFGEEASIMDGSMGVAIFVGLNDVDGAIVGSQLGSDDGIKVGSSDIVGAMVGMLVGKCEANYLAALTLSMKNFQSMVPGSCRFVPADTHSPFLRYLTSPTNSMRIFDSNRFRPPKVPVGTLALLD